MEKPLFPQGLTTTFHTRIKNENTALFITTQTARTSKRNATVINYAEDYFDNEDDIGSFNGRNNYDEDDDEDDDEYEESGHSSNRRRYARSSAYVDPNNQTGNALLNNFQGKLAQRTPHQFFNQIDLIKNSKTKEALLPIRIALDYQNSRIVDHFMWNLNEQLITPEIFADIFCQDMELPSSVLFQIANSITNQLEEYQQLVNIELPNDLEVHVILDLAVNLDKQLYLDKFEWDLNNKDYLPEDFAEMVVSELGLLREFYPAIAHGLHESILKAKRNFLDGRLPQDVINGAAYGRLAGWRFDPENLGQEWCPSVEVLSQWEIEKREIERERDIRRKKRETMRFDDRGGRRRTTRRFDELEH